jgi:formylglycine-generating enzyme required for sulfatase activity
MNQMEFCYVPTGPFLMGSADKDEVAFGDEKPLHQVDLPYGYWLARYPVTVAQFTTFVQHTGYQLRDGSALLGKANCPVVHTTWYDALAFCRWLTEQWWQRGLPVDWQVILPSEAEWEKGARGGLKVPAAPVIKLPQEVRVWQPQVMLKANDNPKRRYPWGDVADPKRANYDEAGIGRTSEVGLFPNGASPYGCEEMSGNAEQWTRSHFKKYPYNPTDGREDLEADNEVRRVLRGGAFSHSARNMRCSSRFDHRPRGRGSLSGFRLALVSNRH